MQGRFQTIGADSPIAQLSGVLRESLSQETNRNGSASSTPLTSPRGERSSRRSSHHSTSSSLSSTHGTPPDTSSHLRRRDSKGSKESTPVSTPRTSTHVSQPIPIPRRPRNTSDILISEESSPTPPTRRESLGAMSSTSSRPSSFKSVTFASGELSRPTPLDRSPPPTLQRKNSTDTHRRILDRKRASAETKFTIPDVISFAIFDVEYQALEDKQKIHEIIVLMEYLGYVREELYMSTFKTRREACSSLMNAMQYPIQIPENEFVTKSMGMKTLLTPRIIIVDSGEGKLSELQRNVDDLFKNENFLPVNINLIQAKISSNEKQLQTQPNVKQEVFSEVGDFSQLQEKLLKEYPYNCFLIVSTKRYMDGITTSHPQFSVYHPQDESSRLQTIHNTQKLASDLYINRILSFLEINALDKTSANNSVAQKS